MLEGRAWLVDQARRILGACGRKKESSVQSRVSLLALVALVVGTSGCSCFRRSQPTVAAMPMCPPANACVSPCGPQSVTYGMPTMPYMAPMQ
jgi:hypothetical protein